MNKEGSRQYIRDVIAGNLRKIREDSLLTQREVSEMFGATESYYREIEAGRKEVSLTRVLEISDALGVSIHDVLEGL